MPNRDALTAATHIGQDENVDKPNRPIVLIADGESEIDETEVVQLLGRPMSGQVEFVEHDDRQPVDVMPDGARRRIEPVHLDSERRQ